MLADIDILKRAETERSHLLRRLASAQEEEQRRISRELDNKVGQTVMGLSLGLKALEQRLANGSGQRGDRSNTLAETLAAQIGRDIHRSAWTCGQPPSMIWAIQGHRSQHCGMRERYHVEADMQTFGRDSHCLLDVAVALYRIVQEGLRRCSGETRTGEEKSALCSSRSRKKSLWFLRTMEIGFDAVRSRRAAPDGSQASGLGFSCMRGTDSAD